MFIILYLEGNHTLFGENLYFNWIFSNGNTDFLPSFWVNAREAAVGEWIVQ